jgi:hypothetical protein
MKAKTAKDPAGEDRRTPAIGHTGGIACRLCKTPVPIDSTWVRWRGSFKELPCSRCGFIMRVRRTDGSA